MFTHTHTHTHIAQIPKHSKIQKKTQNITKVAMSLNAASKQTFRESSVEWNISLGAWVFSGICALVSLFVILRLGFLSFHIFFFSIFFFAFFFAIVLFLFLFLWQHTRAHNAMQTNTCQYWFIAWKQHKNNKGKWLDHRENEIFYKIRAKGTKKTRKAVRVFIRQFCFTHLFIFLI